MQVDDEDEESYSNTDEDPFHDHIPFLPVRENIRMHRRPKSITRDLRDKINALHEEEDEEDGEEDLNFVESERISIIT